VLTLLALFGGGTLTAFADQKEDEAALIEAAKEGRVDDMRTLLDRGVDVNCRCPQGGTPLGWALRKGRGKGAALLIERGADVNDKVAPPLILTAQWNPRNEFVTLLLEHGADVNAQLPDGSTALSLAQRKSRSEVIKLLQEHSTD
jgi:ankyrin repeat protein